MNELTLDSLLGSLSETEETTIEKTASEVSVADQLKSKLTKEASASTQHGESDMSDVTGKMIADKILASLDADLVKQAAHGESGGNKVITDTDEMVAQQDARTTQTPRQGKSVTEVAKALQAKAPAGSADDSVEGSREGNAEAAVSAVPSDIEKAAALEEFLAEGYDFEDAFAMVKEACDHIAREAQDLEKVAAISALIAEGIDFDDAAALVKEAFDKEESVVSEEYSAMEKAAAVSELVSEDGYSFEDAMYLVNEAANAGK